MVEPVEPRRSTAGHRLGAQETLGISTLDPGHRPPTMPHGRHVTVRVRMLDDTEELFDISQRASGKVLFDLVCSQLNLVEGDYFGLEYQDQHKMMLWLDLLKPIIKQLRRPKHTVLRFVVKFFPPDHAQLLEELTRYLFALQIKQDLVSGRLTCNDSSAALLVSHIIQSEIGDFEESQCRSHLLNNNYIPDQMALMDKIMEYHVKNAGQTPAESDYQLLEVARRLEMYGVRLHPAKDREGSKLSLAVAHTGVLVFQGHTKINAFNWSKVRKLSFKRKRFLIKLRPDLNQSSYQDTLEFLMGSRDCCKIFWKICVEYHAFFRLFEEPKPKPKPVLFTRGSSFRFSGRTQKQVIDYVKDSEFKKIPFERKHSRIQHNSRLSPLPSPHRPELPKESVSVAPGDRLDSPSRRHWKEQVLVSADDPLAQRGRGSPSGGQRNGRETPGTAGPAGAEEARGPGHQPYPEHLNTGPASWGGTKHGSSSSIPYIDCSDIDSEYDVAKSRGSRAKTSEDEGVSSQRGSLSVGGLNSGQPPQQDPYIGRMRYRESPPSPKPPLSMGRELEDAAGLSHQAHRGPLHSTMVEELVRAEQCPGSPLAVRHALGSKSQSSSPVLSTFHRTASLSHGEQNGHGAAPPRWEDPRRGPGGGVLPPRGDAGLPHCGSYSPIVSRSPHLQKLHGMRNRSDTDPFVLSQQQLTSTPAHEPRGGLSRTERMAALERRMAANGLSAPGQARLSPVQKRGGRGGDAVGAVPMIDGSTSGSESSDSEMENTAGSSAHPLGYANPMVANPNPSSPMARNMYSFGSLQLDEETEEDSCLALSDEDGGQVFSC